MIAPLLPRPTEILVVDHETHVRWMMQSALELAGYRVHAVADAASARQRLEDEAAAASLVLLGATGPETDAADLYRQIQSLAPGLPAVVCGMATASDDDAAWFAEHRLRRIGRPFDRRTLLKTVLETLADRPVHRRAK